MQLLQQEQVCIYIYIYYRNYTGQYIVISINTVIYCKCKFRNRLINVVAWKQKTKQNAFGVLQEAFDIYLNSAVLFKSMYT